PDLNCDDPSIAEHHTSRRVPGRPSPRRRRGRGGLRNLTISLNRFNGRPCPPALHMGACRGQSPWGGPMRVRSALRALIVSVLAPATGPALVPGMAHATTTAVNCPGDDLQTAINNAAAGDTLQVTGHCTGIFDIEEDLTLQGDGATVLDANHGFVTVRT